MFLERNLPKQKSSRRNCIHEKQQFTWKTWCQCIMANLGKSKVSTWRSLLKLHLSMCDSGLPVVASQDFLSIKFTRVQSQSLTCNTSRRSRSSQGRIDRRWKLFFLAKKQITPKREWALVIFGQFNSGSWSVKMVRTDREKKEVKRRKWNKILVDTCSKEQFEFIKSGIKCFVIKRKQSNVMDK